jgi:hypothetical protein
LVKQTIVWTSENRFENVFAQGKTMIKCPECQKDVSETAKTCPSCGFAIAKALAKAEAKKSAEELLKLWRPASLYVGLLLIVGCCVAAFYSFRFSDIDYANKRYDAATRGGDANYTLLAAEAAINVDQYAKEQREQLTRNAAICFVLGAWATGYGIKQRIKISKRNVGANISPTK